MKPSLRAFTRLADPPASAVQSSTELRERFDTIMRASTLARGLERLRHDRFRGACDNGA